MRSVFILFLIVLTSVARGQQVGVVRDTHDGQPIHKAAVWRNSTVLFTDSLGRFVVSEMEMGDTLHIIAKGYQPQQWVMKTPQQSFFIDVTPATIVLQEVEVTAIRRRPVDTTSWRHVRARKLEAQKRREKQLSTFVPRAYTGSHWNRQLASGSTARLFTINVLHLAKLFKKKDIPAENRVNPEADKLIDQFFNPSDIHRVTGLSGDSLQYFMIRYRPTWDELEDVSEYHILRYTKEAYQRYKMEIQ
ncbi:hypothetical protein [Sphingobacterium suaedae]|uniref:Carboxypeptidase-like regulatory domain-containing protein n=1 Tax=Sphingobacterium suaedae TaxID=1686402 RepID=A0ABW5KFZ5_9SPHI